MIDDDDALDRALAALPLEEPPADLHARIMAATVYAPAPAGVPVPGWERGWLALFAGLAVCGWLDLRLHPARRRAADLRDRPPARQRPS